MRRTALLSLDLQEWFQALLCHHCCSICSGVQVIPGDEVADEDEEDQQDPSPLQDELRQSARARKAKMHR